MRCIAFTLLAFVAAGPALAQQRVVVVPAGAEVVVPARGASGPRLVNAPRPRIPSRNLGPRPVLESGSALGGGSGLAAPALIALPIAAIAAIAASSVPGSGNSTTTAPARTR